MDSTIYFKPKQPKLWLSLGFYPSKSAFKGEYSFWPIRRGVSAYSNLHLSIYNILILYYI